jgi:YHS domain-containing protein
MKSQKATCGMFIFLSFVLLILSGADCTAMGRSPADNPAIKGYDTVAYFTAGTALKGNASYTCKWHGMIWYFSTKENRDLFTQSPEKYAPQYDGYCAWAMTEGQKAATDPEVWKIVDGKLYLSCSKSAYEKWSSDIPGNIKKADANWKKLYGGN